jgi:predicted MFS family arabinose efflux permease
VTGLLVCDAGKQPQIQKWWRKLIVPCAATQVESSFEQSVVVSDRASRNASIVLGLTLPGDTVLYLLLPLHTTAFGVSLAEAGLLLAANRLVRIAGYGQVVKAYERFGPRIVCLVASTGAVAATLSYALCTGFFPLLVGRLLWGVSFAALNIATQALATTDSRGMSRRSGRSRAIISTGPTVGLVQSALLAAVVGPRLVFLVLAGFALFALPAAARLPPGGGRPLRRPLQHWRVPTPLDFWSFVQGFTLDGIFVVGLSILAAKQSPGQATLAAGIALALRYLAEVTFGPSGGAMAERWGASRSLIAVSLGTVAALTLIGMGKIWLGVFVVLLRGIMQPLPAPVLARGVPDHERVPALAAMAMWRDLGAGTGPLIAGLLLPIAPLSLYSGSGGLLPVATLALAFVGAAHWRVR